jgi:hypothetical protein
MSDHRIIDFKINAGKKPISYKAAYVNTMYDKALGLMFKGGLKDDEAMLFIYQQQGKVSMWMKNTFISLDMLFIDKDKKIRHIAENTEPYSTKSISSKYPVKYVLEIKAGDVKKNNIKVGNKVEFELPALLFA